jgi:putative transposase
MSVSSRTVRAVGEIVRYTYRLRPGARAERALMAEWHRCRWLWNEAVHQQKSGRRPTLCKLSKLLTQTRARSAWLREGSQVVQQQMLRTYAEALDLSYKVHGRGKPVIKHRKRALPSLEYTRRGFRLRARRLCLPRGVSIPVVWSRELPSPPSQRPNLPRQSWPLVCLVCQPAPSETAPEAFRGDRH